MEKLACEGLSTLTGELAGTYYPLRGMDKATQNKMINDHFLFRADDRSEKLKCSYVETMKFNLRRIITEMPQVT